jgi:uncharacterized lipoprotein YajG
LLAVTVLSGCSTYVPLVYKPQIDVMPVTGADAVSVRVEVADQRSGPAAEIGAVYVQWGIKTDIVLTTNNVAEFLKSVIEVELAQRGFKLGESNVVVTAELSDFSTWFTMESAWDGTASGHVSLDIHVKRADTSQVYEKQVSGTFSAGDISAIGKYQERYGVDKALQDAMTQLFDDPAFIDSILKAAKP